MSGQSRLLCVLVFCLFGTVIWFELRELGLARELIAVQAAKLATVHRQKDSLESTRQNNQQQIMTLQAKANKLTKRLTEYKESAIAYTCAIRNLLRAEQATHNLLPASINGPVGSPLTHFEAAIQQTKAFCLLETEHKWPLAIPLISPRLKTLAEAHGYRFKLLGDDIYEVTEPSKK